MADEENKSWNADRITARAEGAKVHMRKKEILDAEADSLEKSGLGAAATIVRKRAVHSLLKAADLHTETLLHPFEGAPQPDKKK